MTANVQSMFSLRERPWHGKGVVLNAPVSDAEAIKAAGLDWEVELRELSYAKVTPLPGGDSITENRPVPNWRAVVRTDNDAPLGVVGAGFRVLQNRAMFDILRGIADANPANQLTWETAGALGQGETTWALAKISGMSLSIKGDESLPYVLVCTGHIGNRRVRLTPTVVRVVCQNTMRAALDVQDAARKAGKRDTVNDGWAIGHNRQMELRITEAVNAYRATLAAMDTTVEAWTFLADRPLSDPAWERMMELAMSQPAPAEDEAARARRLERNAERKARLSAILASPTNRTPATAGTMFGAMNALTEWIDHEAGADAGRWQSATFGTGAALKAEVYATAMQLARA